MHSYCRPLRTGLHAQRAVDAIAQAAGFRIFATAARAAWFAAGRIVGDDQRVAVEHRALEARVGAHVLAHLFAHESGVAVGRQAIECDPEKLPGTQLSREDARSQRTNRHKEADKGEPGIGGEAEPQKLLGQLAEDLHGTPGRLVKFDALRALTLGETLHPYERLGPDGLRTGISAPKAACECREEEQRQGGDDQQPGQQEEILWEKRDAEDVELARWQIEQQCLAAGPVQPRKDVEKSEQSHHREDAQIVEAAAYLARIQLLVRRVKLWVASRRIGGHERSARRGPVSSR